MALFTFKECSEDVDTDRLVRELEKLRRSVPEIVDLESGVPISRSASTVDFGVTATFANEQALSAYLAHPDHRRFSTDVLGPHVAAKSIIQIEVAAG